MNRPSVPQYDLFKLIVALILLALLLLMFLRGYASPNAPASVTETVVPQETLAPATTVAVQPSATLLSSPSAGPTTENAQPSATLLSTPSAAPTVAPAATASPTQTGAAPTTTALATTTVAATAAPASTATTTPESPAVASTPAASTPGGDASCNTSLPSRLAVGQRARVLQRLNMRGDAVISAPILQTNPTGTEVEIIGGPVCTPAGERAYLWWQIRLVDGAEGWSAEAQLNERAYLLEPIP